MPRPRLRAWLELLRAPNLLTVPGDPLAGFLLARWLASTPAPPAWALAGAAGSLMIYAGGLVTNDLLDVAEDARDRPHRPLPSRRVSRLGAMLAAAVLLGGGLVAAASAGPAPASVALLLVIAVLTYNSSLKRVPLAGPINMGACRAISVLLGAAVAAGADNPRLLGEPLVIAAAGGMLLYIAAVTQLARGEMLRRSVGWLRWAPPAAAAVWLAAVAAAGREAHWMNLAAYAALAAAAVGRCAHVSAGLAGSDQPRRLQRAVGQWIGCLLIVQSALMALSPWPGAMLAAAPLAAYPLAGWLGQRFAGS